METNLNRDLKGNKDYSKSVKKITLNLFFPSRKKVTVDKKIIKTLSVCRTIFRDYIIIPSCLSQILNTFMFMTV